MTNNHKGFTIVELLVVIVVIGILAAITIVAYNGVQSQARSATIKSDLDNDSKQLAIDYTNNDQYPSTAGAANNGKGLQTSGSNSLAYTVISSTNPPTYCLTIFNGPLSYFVTSSNNVPTSGSCPTSIAIAAGSNPLAILSGNSGSTGIADGALSAGFSAYAMVDTTSYSAFTFSMGTGVNQEDIGINGSPFSRRNMVNVLSSSPSLPQAYPVPSSGVTVEAYIQTPTNRYVRSPGMIQASNNDGYSVTSTPTYSMYLGAPFAKVWIFAGAHSQATSEAVMSAIASDATGANGRPVDLGIYPIAVDTAYASLPITLTTGAAYGTPTPTIQWQKSTNGTTYTDLSGATSSTFVVTSANYVDGSSTYFRAKLTNSQGTTYTTASNLYNGGGGG